MLQKKYAMLLFIFLKIYADLWTATVVNSSSIGVSICAEAHILSYASLVVLPTYVQVS